MAVILELLAGPGSCRIMHHSVHLIRVFALTRWRIGLG